MITPDVSARYTAREALDALAKVLSELDGETLSTRVSAPPVGPYSYPRVPWQAYDRWSSLPEEFVAKCAAEMAPVRPSQKCFYDNWEPFFVDHF
ncbi:hypothetical protein QCA50_012455 [Cerrena zonata]|uniref:Uncharacterized protein n=1 Tax=Cerrena zonata TaxID=2478898 RepID=A0AAW0FTX8_9APHY